MLVQKQAIIMPDIYGRIANESKSLFVLEISEGNGINCLLH